MLKPNTSAKHAHGIGCGTIYRQSVYYVTVAIIGTAVKVSNGRNPFAPIPSGRRRCIDIRRLQEVLPVPSAVRLRQPVQVVDRSDQVGVRLRARTPQAGWARFGRPSKGAVERGSGKLMPDCCQAPFFGGAPMYPFKLRKVGP